MDYLIKSIVWVLAVYGTALIISMSTIFLPARNWLMYSFQEVQEDGSLTAIERKWKLPGKLITCIMCMGFWSGVFWTLTFYDPMESVDSNILLHLLNGGVVGTSTTWLIHLTFSSRMAGQ